MTSRGRYTVSVIAYFVVTMATAYPWHMMLFHDEYVAMGAFTRGEPIMLLGMAAVLIQAGVFSWLYPLWLAHRRQAGKAGNAVVDGIRFCLALGLTVYSVMVLATAAKFTIEPLVDFLLLGTIFQFIQFLAVGVVFGLIHRE